MAGLVAISVALGPGPAGAAPGPSGWDYNLATRCVTTPHPDQGNYFADDLQCGPDGKRWTVAVQSEATYGGSCPGPTNQSFPVNGPGSPVTMTWEPHVDEAARANWSVALTSDFRTNPHPCGDGYFTWFMFMDHVAFGGGPFPRPDRLAFSATVNFTDAVSRGASRAIARWQGAWDGKARVIEMRFQGTGYPDAYRDDPLIMNYRNTPTVEFVSIDGAALGLSVAKGTDAALEISWSTVIASLIHKGFLEAPASGWATAQTRAVGLGHEVMTKRSPTWAEARLWFTNFRVEETDGAAPVLHQLTVTRSGVGTGTVTSVPVGIDCGLDCSEAFPAGTEVSLTASPDPGSTFAGWGQDCSGTSSCVVTMDAARAVTATFEPSGQPATHSLTVTRAGSGQGRVSSMPAGISCGRDCAEDYPAGTSVTLTPEARSGAVFTGWSGACSGTGPCTVVMDVARSVTATFQAA